MKRVIQLNEDGYVIGFSIADESPLEPGVYHIPRNCIDAELPNIPANKNAKWNGSEFIFEDVVEPIEPEPIPLTYKELRFNEYPDFKDYLDGIVKGDQEQIQKYIDDCLAVKQKYPKPL